MLVHLRPALTLFALLSVLTGVVYPALVTGAAQLLFPERSRGSLIEVNGRTVGSALIGQPFDSPGYFWARPSATGPWSYNAVSSSGSNLGPLNPDLLDAVRDRVAALRKHASGATPLPVDLVTASGSGLDPHISPAAALFQVRRVSKARGLTEAEVRALVESHLEPRTLGIFGEPRVNVLLLNLSLDAQGSKQEGSLE